MEAQELTINPRELHVSSYPWNSGISSRGSSASPSPLESHCSDSSGSWGSVDGHAPAFHNVAPLGSPFVACVDEHLYLNELFRSAAQEVERLDKAILDSQIELVQIFQQKQKEIDTLKSRRSSHITRWKKFFALIYRLSDDVLLLIFEAFVLELDQSPWMVAHVSKRFREVAFRARKIWARILLKPSFNGIVRNHGGWEVCKSSVQLSRALSRAGGVDLSLSLHSCDLDSATSLTSHPSRWSNVTYVDHGNSQVDEQLFGNHARLASVTKLHVIGGGSLENSRLSGWIQKHPPPNLMLMDHSLHTYRGGNWGNLRTLQIKLPQLSPAAHAWITRSAVMVKEILHASQDKLTSLSLENVIFPENSFAASIEFPQVAELSLRCVTQWHTLHAPNASKYLLAFGKGDMYEHTAHLRFTRQVALEFTSAFGTQSRGVLTSPDEDQLSITGTRGWSIDHRGTEGGIPSQPYIQHLHDIQISSDDLLRQLRLLSSVVELYIHNSALAPIFFKAFIVDPTSSRLGKPPLLPHLQLLNVQLVLNARIQGLKTKDSYDSTFTKISEVRKTKLGVLKTLAVQYPKDIGGGSQWY